jgi:hypothetical protein
MHDIRHLFASNPCIGEIKRANPYEEGICFYANGERQKDSLSLDVSGDHAAGKRRILKAGIQAQRSVLVARHSDSLLDEFIDCIPPALGGDFRSPAVLVEQATPSIHTMPAKRCSVISFARPRSPEHLARVCPSGHQALSSFNAQIVFRRDTLSHRSHQSRTDTTWARRRSNVKRIAPMTATKMV